MDPFEKPVENSRLYLKTATEPADREDSPGGKTELKPGDIAPLNLRSASIAILAACETAMTETENEEYEGLPAAFLVAGARTVIGSLWAAEVLASGILVHLFHENLYGKQMEKATALHEAHQQMRNLTDTEIEEMVSEWTSGMEDSDREDIEDSLSAKKWERDQKDGDRLLFDHPSCWAVCQCIGSGYRPNQTDGE